MTPTLLRRLAGIRIITRTEADLHDRNRRPVDKAPLSPDQGMAPSSSDHVCDGTLAAALLTGLARRATSPARRRSAADRGREWPTAAGREHLMQMIQAIQGLVLASHRRAFSLAVIAALSGGL